MKYDTYEDYKWFILGASITSSKVLWENQGNSNKELKTSISEDGSVARIGYSTVNDGGTENG